MNQHQHDIINTLNRFLTMPSYGKAPLHRYRAAGYKKVTSRFKDFFALWLLPQSAIESPTPIWRKILARKAQ
jgi:hypothetical protein